MASKEIDIQYDKENSKNMKEFYKFWKKIQNQRMPLNFAQIVGALLAYIRQKAILSNMKLNLLLS